MTVPSPLDPIDAAAPRRRDRVQRRAGRRQGLRIAGAVLAVTAAPFLWVDAAVTREVAIRCDDAVCEVALRHGTGEPTGAGTFPMGGLREATFGCAMDGTDCGVGLATRGWLAADPPPTGEQLAAQRAILDAVPGSPPTPVWRSLFRAGPMRDTSYGDERVDWPALVARPGGSVLARYANLPGPAGWKLAGGWASAALGAGLAARAWRRRGRSPQPSAPLALYDAPAPPLTPPDPLAAVPPPYQPVRGR